MAAAAPPQPIAQELHDETPTQDVDARVEDAEEHQADAAPWEKSFPPPESPWMPVRPQLEPLKDFCIAMPSLAVQEVDFFSLPPQLRMNLAFLKQIDPRDIVSNEAAAEMGPLLPPLSEQHKGRRTLVLDLDETLVHSSFRKVERADIVINVELEGEHHPVFVLKRPFVDEFLVKMAELYEVVVYTASMSAYANPLMDQLDKLNLCTYRLFREACTRSSGGYMKDLSKIGRNLDHVIIIDNSPICYALQPYNAIPIQTWKHDPKDRELLDLIPILTALADVESIPVVLKEVIWADQANGE
eukprot:gnl/TRDRNA2_/TRDRNA2_131463_c0_seq4.p1 gnl/TRDRNA2_/TRDRNA2_131463_c0~~gnl/TRDRNA2_/TRDRNA2_131463_c0_seq4.p1  ORF type:complete len:300 (+),score=70.46 gnl/TRDRNA2_/TRDRNA2_131463_c0_seq4:164-1063(+)